VIPARGKKQPTGQRVDARTERWREHRIKVRNEFVDAAFRALDKFGPDVSMDDIAKEAGAAKPKLYRHFEDKIDLYNAIVDRTQELLWERLIASVNLLNDTTRELVRRGAAEYALVVTEHPNAFRFMVHSHFTQQADESERALQSARQYARRAAVLLAETLDHRSVDIDRAELTIYTVFGTVASATDWWLGASRNRPLPMPIEQFVDYLATTISSIAESNARMNGVLIAPDQPLHLAFSMTEPTE